MSFIADRVVMDGLTFDDVLLIPAYSEVLPRNVDLTTKFSRNITLNIPMVSAAMDTVTEAKLAIAISLTGSLLQPILPCPIVKINTDGAKSETSHPFTREEEI